MLKSFMKYYQPYKRMLFMTILGSLLFSLLELVFPLILRYALNDLLPTKNVELLLRYAGILLALYLLGYLINYNVNYYGNLMGASIENDMRLDLFRHLSTLSLRFYDNNKTGQIISRITSDISEIGQLAFSGPNDMIVCFFTMVGTVVIMLSLNWRLALVMFVLLAYKTYDSVTVNYRMKRAFSRNRALQGDVTAQVSDSLAGMRVVQAFGNEKYEYDKFTRVSNAFLQARIDSFDIMARFHASISFFTNVINVILLIVGGLMIAHDLLEFSDFMAFYLYVGTFMRPVMRLSILLESYQRGVSGYTRFCEIMDERPDFVDSPGAVSCEGISGDITFHHVNFSYEPDVPILKNIDFSIGNGQMVAIVGPTGSGKTTVCSLIPRFYDVTAGAITIDDRDIRNFTISSLRDKIGIVQQEVFIFSENIRNNIAYGRPGATEEEIIAAAKAAEAHDFIMSLPDGYDTYIGERGVKLSGGQKQRISIARIFLKNPALLILDEATSALDNETEKKIQKSINNLAKNRTTIVIAHRLATVQKADKIVVLTREGIAEEGKHEDLLALNGLYTQLYEAQFQNFKA